MFVMESCQFAAQNVQFPETRLRSNVKDKCYVDLESSHPLAECAGKNVFADVCRYLKDRYSSPFCPRILFYTANMDDGG